MSDPKTFGKGAGTGRVEDDRFITGHGRYTSDLFARDQVAAFFVRTPHAHAEFNIGDLDAARAMPGVHLIWTAEDLPKGAAIPIVARPVIADGTALHEAPIPLICEGRVRQTGDVVAMVVADTVDIAQQAAELIEVDYVSRPAICDVEDAAKQDAPVIWSVFGGNLAFASEFGDAAEADRAFDNAAQVVRVKVVHNRLISNYMEPRAALATYDSDTEQFTLTLPSQGVHPIRNAIAAAMQVDPAQVRVLTEDVGGGFGPKYFAYRDYPLLALASRELGRPVNWTSSRMEHFVADVHGRDAVVHAELAIDEKGRILAMRNTWRAAIGAYMSQYGAFVPWIGATMSKGVYDIPAASIRLEGYYTNTTPTDAYRGAGRPEASLTIERLMDAAGRATGLGPVEFRRRNFIGTDQFPYDTKIGQTYDSGEFEAQMDAALEKANYAGFHRRLATSTDRGRLRGIGLSTYIEACAFAGSETVKLRLADDGTLLLDIGTQSSGQGHETVYGGALADAFGVDISAVSVVQGDTSRLETGGGTAGSRSIPYGMPAISDAGTNLITNIKNAVGAMHNLDPSRITVRDGIVSIEETNRSFTLAEIAENVDADQLTAYGKAVQTDSTFPNGTHVCEVEIAPETGNVQVISLVVVDDFGVTINPTLLEGQIHGGIAQGLGQAVLERTVYDEDGQLLSASLMDYAMPRAADMPDISLTTRNVPCKNNAMGIKGGGEAGAIGATPAITNAIIDALHRVYGIAEIDCPATPERVWRAIQNA